MAAAIVSGDVQPLKRSHSQEIIPPSMRELLVVLLGNNWSERSSVGNLLLGEIRFSTEEEPDFVTVKGQIKEKEIVLINTPDLLNPNISEDKLRQHVELCKRLSDPGPHVFLLVLQPEGFTEEHRLRIYRVLELFSDQSFDHSMVLISASREESSSKNNPSFRDLIRECRYRYLFQKNLERSELLIRLSQIVKENNREDLSGDGSEDSGLTMKSTLSEELERIQKEKEDKMKEEEENLKRKHQEELKIIKEQIELTEKQLQKKDECINKEREMRKKEESQKQEWRRKAETAEKKLQSEREQRENAEKKLEQTRKKEQEEDEKRRKKEESQKQEWKRKAEAAEKKFQSEREQRENAERKLEQNRKEMKKERDAWEKERKEIYERMHQEGREVLEEERTRNRKLQEEFYQKRKRWMYSLFGLIFLIFSSLFFYLFLTQVTGSGAEEIHIKSKDFTAEL